MADDSTYVCPQCGPDPRGSQVHTEEMHTWHGADSEREEQLAGENARLRQRAEKAEDERDRLQARLDTATAHVDELRGQRDEAREQRNLARRERNIAERVVEAAEAWADDVKGVGRELVHPLEWALKDTLDAWRAAQADQTAPADRPSATESQDQGADDGAGTEGSQAQGGARGYWMGIPLRTDPAMPDDEIRIVDSVTGERLGTITGLAAPADPAGLDAAIEAGARAAWGHPRVVWANQDIPWAIREVAESAVRAAAPHLRAAALNEAAAEAHELDEELLRRRDKCGHGRERAEGMAMGYEMAAYLVRKLEVGFRERAGREAT